MEGHEAELRGPQLLATRGVECTLALAMQVPISRAVTEADTGMRLDQVLARQPEVGSRARAKELIDSGLVRLAGQRVKAGLFLAAGQTVQFSAPPEAPAAPPPPAQE